MIKNLLLHYARRNSWLQFSDPIEVIATRELENVTPLLDEIESKVGEGLYAAGFISYEAAPAFDTALTTHDPTEFPLLCFGLYKTPKRIELPLPSASNLEKHAIEMQLPLNPFLYAQKINAIKQLIEAGDTYQVNFTMLQQALFEADPWELFLNFCPDTPFGAFIELEDYAICSASPELFFELHEEVIMARPMKGTAKRGMTLEDDLRQREKLRRSDKDKAENIMIVDMIRNDMSKIENIANVRVAKTFNIEKYPTVWQMTSSVSAESKASISEVMRALFPCASIIGAPKVNTMSIINSLESSPRNIYTGSIGFMCPGGNAQFNVAIRTALIDKKNKRLEYGVGGGIVWDSVAHEEYEECLLKTSVITQPQHAKTFSLLETMLWTPQDGIFLLEYHMKRLQQSAAYFDIKFEREKIGTILSNLCQTIKKSDYKLRLTLNHDGEVSVTADKIDFIDSSGPGSVSLAKYAINSNDVFLHHKTTRRGVYEHTRAEFPNHDDVVLWNHNNEVTESTIANIVIRHRNKLITPPLSCGLLAGTFRQYLLNQRQIEEQVITVQELENCSEIYLINSVRKWLRVSLS